MRFLLLVLSPEIEQMLSGIRFVFSLPLSLKHSILEFQLIKQQSASIVLCLFICSSDVQNKMRKAEEQ